MFGVFAPSQIGLASLANNGGLCPPIPPPAGPERENPKGAGGAEFLPLHFFVFGEMQITYAMDRGML